jgi:hypothetical protein
VAVELGHTSPQMLYSTYRELVCLARLSVTEDCAGSRGRSIEVVAFIGCMTAVCMAAGQKRCSLSPASCFKRSLELRWVNFVKGTNAVADHRRQKSNDNPQLWVLTLSNSTLKS